MTAYFGVIGNRDYIKIKGERRPFWEFLDTQPAGWLCSLAYAPSGTSRGRQRIDVPDAPMIWDCGAWSYKAEETFNRDSALRSIELCPAPFPVRPMAAVHGLTLEERIENARFHIAIGYQALALGGLAGQASRKQMIVEVVGEIRRLFPNVWLHVLGLSSPAYAAEWQRIGVDSFDGASHFKQAFTAGKFFMEQEGRLAGYPAARPGQPLTAPACDCRACLRLRADGVDTRSYGSNEHNMGRAAHNLNQLMRAINSIQERSLLC